MRDRTFLSPDDQQDFEVSERLLPRSLERIANPENLEAPPRSADLQSILSVSLRDLAQSVGVAVDNDRLLSAR